eukprot:scaffold9641_cov258-Amphora_coffeaeformis.AAC.2
MMMMMMTTTTTCFGCRFGLTRSVDAFVPWNVVGLDVVRFLWETGYLFWSHHRRRRRRLQLQWLVGRENPAAAALLP